MKKLAVTLAAAIVVALTGCGSDSTSSPLITYVARAQSDNVPHLYTLKGITGTPTAVTIPIPTNAQYVTSNSDATAVTYCYSGDSGYDIFLMGTDGQEQELTTGADACESVFSPDGKSIAYVSGATGTYGIYTMHVDGTNQAALYAPSASSDYAFLPEFSPDGKSVVFYLEVSTPGAPQTQRQKNARSPWLQSQNGRSKALAHRSVHTEVADPTQGGWYSMALTDTTPTLVYATTDWWGPAVFSSDGKKLLLTLYDGTHDNISSINLDGTGLTSVTTNAATDDFSPVPYKNLILFNQWNSDNSSWDIYVMDQTGANQKLVHSTASTYETLIDAYWED